MNTLLSIGILTYSTRPRGSVVHAAALSEALFQLGHAVTLYALAKDGDAFYRPLACPTVLLHAAAAPADPDQLIAQRVREMAEGLRARRFSHDLVHAEDCLAASGVLARGPRRAPLVRTVHHVERYSSTYLMECQRRSVLEADAVITVSGAGRRDVQREFGVCSQTITNGVDAARFRKRSALALAARRRALTSDAEARFVLSVGGVEPRKNSLNALDAMTGILSRSRNVHWILAGGASVWEHREYRARFAERVAGLREQVRARIHELGSVTEAQLTELYQLSDVVLYPSLQEGFGLCALEALAAGTPLVVSNAEPFTEYLDPSCATFVDPAAPDEIQRAVSDLLLDATLASDRAEVGLQRAERFSWSDVAREHVDVYQALVTKARHSRNRTDAVRGVG